MMQKSNIFKHSCIFYVFKNEQVSNDLSIWLCLTFSDEIKLYKLQKFVINYLCIFRFVSDEATTSFSDNNDSTITNPEDSPESLEHKNLRGTKIAKRARSFKDDFFEKISQMRTPTNTISR